MAETPARATLLAVLAAAGLGQADAVRLLDEAITEAGHEIADLIDAIKPECTALTGPVWYGDGWHEAAHHLHDLADDYPRRKRQEAAER